MIADGTSFTIALTGLQWVFIGIGGAVVLVIVLILGQFFSLWLQALLSNASMKALTSDAWRRECVRVLPAPALQIRREGGEDR